MPISPPSAHPRESFPRDFFCAHRLLLSTSVFLGVRSGGGEKFSSLSMLFLRELYGKSGGGGGNGNFG